MKETHLIELLAPAQNFDCGKAAIDHGADAVYIGGPSFGARKSAANTIDDIAKLVQYAHRYRVKVYTALNTLLYDREIDLAVELIHRYYDIGVDAVIIQDMGLLECDLPPIPLHASTQANNITPAKVKFLEQVGFQQVVLAREMNLEQIEDIRQQTSVSLEFFVHGALCVSYSGQCYISKIMADRSANRGNCAQFCRHRFTVKDNSGRIIDPGSYLLSLKDLDLSSHLESLLLAGISSFKIEGRLKNEEYVKNVTAYYRQELDRILHRHPSYSQASSGSCTFSFTPDPEKTFHRDTTTYYIADKRNKAVNPITPKSTGQKLGSVSSSSKEGFGINTDQELHNGDGLCFTDHSGALKGMRINSIKNGLIQTQEKQYPPKGTTVYRNLDTAFQKQLQQSIDCRKIAVSLTLRFNGTKIELLAEDENDVQTSITSDDPFETAHNREKALENIDKQLKKSGDTCFIIKEVVIQTDIIPFLPVSMINTLRRSVLNKLQEKREQEYTVEQKKITPNSYPWLSDTATRYDNIINSKAEAFYRRHGVTTFPLPAESCENPGEISLMTTRYCIRYQLDLCPHNCNTAGAQVYQEPFFIEDNTGRYRLHFDCKACRMTITRD